LPISCGEDLTRFNEGCVLTARPDAKGHWEIGYGHDINPSPGLTWTQEQADAQFEIDYPLACSRAEADLGAGEYVLLSPQRQAVLNDMAYEIGGAGLAGFTHMLSAVRYGDWQEAADSLKSSLLFSQVPAREARNVAILLTGEWGVK
jgi:GH24 family phage-related lysozyme (muramidase)